LQSTQVTWRVITEFQVFTKEESVGIASPALSECEAQIRDRPTDNGDVIDCDDRGNEDLEPAQPFKYQSQLGEGSWRGTTQFVSQTEFHDHKWNTGRYHGEKVWNKKCAAAVFVSHIGETPDIP